MLSYVMLGTNDLEKAKAFYDALLPLVGGKRVFETFNGQAYGAGGGQAMFMITKPFDGQAATIGNGSMVALRADSPEQVDEVYAKAIALGATDEGAPGPRANGRVYAGYFRDLDGNKLNAICFTS
ncbi:MAG: VOC family protein [Sphingomonadales bacterium]